MKSAVVTGPTGAVGIALIEQLVQNNIDVLAVVNPNSNRSENVKRIPGVKIVELDISDISRLQEFTEGQRYDVFYHLAWDGTFGNARNNMQGQIKNIQYTLDAVEAACSIGCKRFIGAGSQAEYGRVDEKLNSKTPTFPENGYGIAKLCAGQMSRILCEQKGIEHIWTRILSVYGPYDGPNTLVSYLIKSLYNGDSPSLTAGEQIWDYLYSKDAGRALRLIGELGKNNSTYCVGSGDAIKLRDYVEVIKNLINPGTEIGYGDKPYGDKQVMFLSADLNELEVDTGFKPLYSFEDGIRETIKWLCDTMKEKNDENN